MTLAFCASPRRLPRQRRNDALLVNEMFTVLSSMHRDVRFLRRVHRERRNDAKYVAPGFYGS